MQISFAPSRQSSVGIEWELGLVDLSSGELAPAGQQVVEACQGGPQEQIRGEYLQTMVELTSGVHLRVVDAVDDLAEQLAQASAAAAELGVGLLGSGTHPFSIAAAQPITPGARYQRVAERNAYWGSQMAICGTHVHIGVDHQNKALPITAGLARFYPYLLAISCSSPYWEGADSGYASQRTMLFQQLATNGLPYPMQDWAAFEDYAEDLLRSGMISLPDEIRWDVRPSPKFGTVENRVADSVPTLGELGAIAALTQCFVEFTSRSYIADHTFEALPPWLVKENKWRAARYGLDAEVITPRHENPIPMRQGLALWLERLEPVAKDLDCTAELHFVWELAERGVSYQRQLATGSPQAALQLLLAETGSRTPFAD